MKKKCEMAKENESKRDRERENESCTFNLNFVIDWLGPSLNQPCSDSIVFFYYNPRVRSAQVMETMMRREAPQLATNRAETLLTQQHLPQYEFFMCHRISLQNETRKKGLWADDCFRYSERKKQTNLSIIVIEWDGGVPIAAA